MGIVSGGGGGGGTPFNGGTITGALTVAPTDIDATPLTVKGALGQETTVVDLRVDPTHTALIVDESGQLDATVRSSDLSTSRLLFALHTSGAAITAKNSGGTNTAQFFVGGAAATFGDGAGATWATAAPTGVIITGSHAAPADGDLSAGDCALWFDQTNGAAKLMVKAKQANGTVVAASIALA